MSEPSAASTPILSVIVPVRNEKGYLRATMESILADAPAGGMEVILVDGMSDDGTAEEARALAAEDPRIKVMDNPSRFVPQAMNLGLAAATAPYIGRIDGHCLVVPGYFEGCLARLREGAWDCVGGAWTNEGRTPAGRAVAAATSSPIGVGSSRHKTGAGGECEVDTLSFGIYRREVFDRIGTFDEAFVRNQDDELNLRLTRAGGRILLVPSLRIRYFVRDSIRMLGRQYYQYGYWKWRVFRKHGRFASMRHVAPSGFLMALAASAVASIFTAAGKIAFSLLAIPYLAVIAAESLRLGSKRDAPAPKVALALMTLHFSYGYGLLRALVDAVVRRDGGAARAAPTTSSR